MLVGAWNTSDLVHHFLNARQSNMALKPKFAFTLFLICFGFCFVFSCCNGVVQCILALALWLDCESCWISGLIEGQGITGTIAGIAIPEYWAQLVECSEGERVRVRVLPN